jgi:putative membrane protein
MGLNRFFKQFNWRFLLVRILMNAIALAITAAVTPKIYFVDRSVWNWLLMALMLGVLNALLKPVLQFLTLPFIFVTYGLVVVLVNALLLWLLSLIFPNRFAVESFWWALLGGLVLGLLSSFLESLLGLTMPIVPESDTALRRQLEVEARGIGWFVASERAEELEQQALADQLREEASAEDAAVPDVAAPEPEDASPTPAAEVADPGSAPAPASPSVDEPAGEQEEDRS